MGQEKSGPSIDEIILYPETDAVSASIEKIKCRTRQSECKRRPNKPVQRTSNVSGMSKSSAKAGN